MDVKEYFKTINEYIDNLTDEEFDALLIKSGINQCPYEEEETAYFEINFPNTEFVYTNKNKIYNDNFNMCNDFKEVCEKVA